MAETRKGRQTPTQSVTLPYRETKGQEAIDYYNETGRTAQEWQELLIYDILAVGEDGLWVHTKFGYSVPRRNGKNEVVAIRELYGLMNGEHILHTAHRTTTSSSASKRLAALLSGRGYTEVARPKKGEKYDKHYTYSKQMGLECITILGEGGGICSFRTRSSKGGLGLNDPPKMVHRSTGMDFLPFRLLLCLILRIRLFVLAVMRNNDQDNTQY